MKKTYEDPIAIWMKYPSRDVIVASVPEDDELLELDGEEQP